MPTALIDPGKNIARSLSRAGNRANKTIAWEKAIYPQQASLSLRKLHQKLMDQFARLCEPIEQIVGSGDRQRVVEVTDTQGLCEVAKTLVRVIEARGDVVGYARPAKRPVMAKDDNSKTLDVTNDPVDAEILRVIEQAQGRANGRKGGKSGESPQDTEKPPV